MGKGEYGEGALYQRASDGRWIATFEAGWTKAGKRRRITVSAKTEAECKRRRRDKRKEIEREGRAVASGRTTVKAWAETWLKIRSTIDRPKTHTTDRGAVEAWIIPTIGHKRLTHLTPEDIRSVTSKMREAGKSTSSSLRYHSVLIRMLKAAVEEGHNVPPRVLAVKPPKAAAHDRAAIPIPNALALLEQAGKLPHGSRWAMALLQGMRQGECLGLTRDEIGDGYLSVSWQLQALPYVDPQDRSKGFLIPDGYEARRLEHSYHLVRPKSKAGWRVIPLIPPMRAMLDAWLQAAPESQHGLVWPTDKGGPRNPRKDTEEWRAIQAAANVAHPSGRPFHVHEIRNTTATILMELEIPESVRIAIMGHSNITTTRGYETVNRTQTMAALAKVGDVLGLR